MRIRVAITVFAFITRAAAAGMAQSTSPSFTIAIGTPQSTLKVGSEIRVNIVLTNTTNHDIQIYRGRGERGVQLHS